MTTACAFVCIRTIVLHKRTPHPANHPLTLTPHLAHALARHSHTGPVHDRRLKT